MFDEDFLLCAALHADLDQVEVGSFVRGEEDVVMGRILVALEQARNDVAAEMIVAPSGEMAGAEDFFVLDIGTGDGKNLGSEPEFAEGAGHRIIPKPGIVGVDGRLISLKQTR